MQTLIESILGRVDGEGLAIDARAIADAVWLAAWQLKRAGQTSIHSDETLRKNSSLHNESNRQDQQTPTRSELATVTSDSAIDTVERANTESSVSASLPFGEGSERTIGRTIRLPTAPALPERARLLKALRPLRRRIPSRHLFTIDAEATGEELAEAGIWNPVFKPTSERWLRATVIVDDGLSMRPWRSTAQEWLSILKASGVFHAIHVLRWCSDQTEQLPRPEFVPGDHLVLLFSDTIRWNGVAIKTQLQSWQTRALTVLVHALPESMWSRTRIGNDTIVHLSRGASLTNAALRAKPFDELLDDSVPPGYCLPLAALTPKAISCFALMATSVERRALPGIVVGSGSASAVSLSMTELPAERRVELFRSSASRTARQLACICAVFPTISLQIIRLIRETFLLAAGHVHEAEFLLSSLLRSTQRAPTSLTVDDDWFEFHPGVAQRLQEDLPRDYGREVIKRVSEYVERGIGSQFGDLRSFRAFLDSPETASITESVSTHPFFELASSYLGRLGPDFVRATRPRKQASIRSFEKGPRIAAEKPKRESSSAAEETTSAITDRDVPWTRVEDQIASVVSSPEGKEMVNSSNESPGQFWDTTSRLLLVISTNRMGRVTSVAFSCDGQTIASGSWDGNVLVWEVSTGHNLPIHCGHDLWVESVTYSPDGIMIVSGSRDNTVRLWDAASGYPLSIFQGHDGGVTSVCCSPDGSRIASGSHDKTVRVWNARTGSSLAVFQGHTHGVWSVSFSPDGRCIASGSFDHTIRVWDTYDGCSLISLLGHSGAVTSVCFSPDGERIVSGSEDTTVRVWDARSGRAIAVLRGHEDWVRCISYSPDGRSFASGSDDKTIRLWDAHAYIELAVFRSHKDCVSSVAFSPDGTRIVSGSFDKTIRIWDAVNFASKPNTSSYGASYGSIPSLNFSSTPQNGLIYPCYSHHDWQWVRKVQQDNSVAKAQYADLGDLKDARERNGMNEAMRRKIDEAHAFQLFWSHAAANSRCVQQEWEYAMSLNRPNFISIISWDRSAPRPPMALQNCPFVVVDYNSPVADTITRGFSDSEVANSSQNHPQTYDVVEAISRAIYESNESKHLSMLDSSGFPETTSWSNSPHQTKDFLIRDTSDRLKVISVLGIRVVEPTEPESAVVRLTDEEIESAAKGYHERWVQDKLTNGWSYASIRDDDARQHPQIQPWESLHPLSRGLNRAVFQDFPRMVLRAGYKLVRETRWSDPTDNETISAPRKIFLLYDPADGESVVRRLYDDLSAAGFDVWFDRVKVPSRSFAFLQEIRDAIASCDRLLLIIGPHSSSSDSIRREWQFAYYEAQKSITPILIRGRTDWPNPNDASIMPDELNALHCEDFRDEKQYSVKLKQLIQNIQASQP